MCVNVLEMMLGMVAILDDFSSTFSLAFRSSHFFPIKSKPNCLQKAQNQQSGSRSRAEVLAAEKMWVMRSRNLAVVVTLAWIAWIVVIQFILPKMLPTSWYVRIPDSADYTGW